MPKELPRLGLALTVARKCLGWSEGELAAAAHMPPNRISDYERGTKPLTLPMLEKLFAALGLQREAIDDALAAVDRLRAKAAAPVYPLETGESSAERRRIESVALASGHATSEVVRPLIARLSYEIRSLVDRQQARAPWERLKARPADQRVSLIRKAKTYRSWAVCELACEESIKVAPHSATRALEYAALAVEIARLAPGEELFRRRLQGYAEAHLANARRAHGEPGKADEIFGRALALWKAGTPADPGLLNEARVLGLEASLHIDHRRFTEALKRLNQALDIDRHDETSYLLINRARVLEHLGDYDGAIATLRQAAPRIDVNKEPRLLFGLRFNLLSNLCHLERFAEAEALLPEVRTLAERLAQEIDLLRTLWLEGWVAGGVGQRQKAVAALEHVTHELVRLKIPFDAALAGLELAVLYLEERRTAEVRAMAEELLAIFKAQKVEREALAALTMFCKAAREETATAELARRLAHFLYRAQHQPELRFQES